MEHIADMKNYIRSRQNKGKTATQIKEDLMKAGYDGFAATGLITLHWDFGDNSEEKEDI